jgi:Stealth protein CR2, conserved region 2/Stealth protein CR3, conserved region 3
MNSAIKKINTFIALITFIVLIVLLALNFKVIKENFTDSTSIDAVITYVNDSDPNWIKMRQQYNNKAANETINSRQTWRFQSSNEIMYCLMCIQKNCPFFRNIYVVIAIPSQKCDISFLNNDTQRKIKFITHDEFYYNKNDLPTFNSISIEHNIHNIKNLSEHFVYFNDDCFVNKPAKISDFITNDNKIIIHKEDTFISPRGTPSVNEAGYFSAIKNSNVMLDKLFPKTQDEARHIIKHVPQIQIVSVHKKLKELFPKEFKISSSSKFRNTDCNLMSAFLAEYYSLYSGLGVTASKSSNPEYVQVFVNCDKNRGNQIIQKIKTEKPKFINIQSAVKNNQCNLEDIYKSVF